MENNVQDLYLIEFGLARKNKIIETNEHYEMRDERKGFVGTGRFASIHAHEGIEQTRRDDLEGLAYTLIWLLKGSLPWCGLPGDTEEEKLRNIYEKKITTDILKMMPILI